MTKSGTFELSDEAYDTLVKFYETFKLQFGDDTFEEFCGKMLMRGSSELGKDFITILTKKRDPRIEDGYPQRIDNCQNIQIRDNELCKY